MAAPNPAFQFNVTPLPTPFFFTGPHVPSDYLAGTNHRVVGEIQLKRHGLIVSNRKFSSRYRWRLSFTAISEAEIKTFGTYFSARKFRMLPLGDPGTYFIVRWMEQEFKPTQLRGDNFNLAFTIEST